MMRSGFASIFLAILEELGTSSAERPARYVPFVRLKPPRIARARTRNNRCGVALSMSIFFFGLAVPCSARQPRGFIDIPPCRS